MERSVPSRKSQFSFRGIGPAVDWRSSILHMTWKVAKHTAYRPQQDRGWSLPHP
jgi:hypothetical protein